MKQEIKRICLFVILPLLLTALTLLYVGEAEAVQYEDLILKQGGQRIQIGSGEESIITPPIKIIGPER